jgi:preprotein translocase subunit SecG
MIAIALVAVVLMQRSEGGALGIGGGGGGFLTGRGTANLLTRITAALALAFFITSISLSLLAKQSRAPTSIFDGAPPAASTPAAPAEKGSGGTGLREKLKVGEGEQRVPVVPQSK